MPTIAEIIAAKKAKENAGTTAPAAAQAAPVKRESLSEKLETVEAINRIDPPGKLERATAARKSAGLILNDAPIAKEPLPEVPAEPRALGARVGEPINILPECPTIQAKAWDAVLNRWETDLIIMADPEPGSESAWLALKPITGQALPILLHKLPFWPHPQRQPKDGDPY